MKILLRKIKLFLTNFIDIIVPKCCLSCGKELDYKNKQDFICDECADCLFCIDQKNCCEKCGYPLDFYNDSNKIMSNFSKNNSHFLCHNCISFKNKFNIARSCFQYKGYIRRILMNFKFYFQTESTDFIGESLFKTYSFISNSDVLCCIPVTKTKLFLNGYNHASLIASSFYKKLKNNEPNSKMIFLPDLLLKNINSQQSKTLSKQERLQKKHHFIVNDKYLSDEWRNFFSKKTILIIDDIMTTGATLNSASYVLKKTFKNINIECLTFARTMLY